MGMFEWTIQIISTFLDPHPPSVSLEPTHPTIPQNETKIDQRTYHKAVKRVPISSRHPSVSMSVELDGKSCVGLFSCPQLRLHTLLHLFLPALDWMVDVTRIKVCV